MFRLAHLSDPHLGPLPPVRLRELMNKRLTGYANWRLGRADAQDMETLSAVIADVKASEPDHIAVTGDFANIGLASEFATTRRFLENLGTPEKVSAIPGNHDIYVSGSTAALTPAIGPWMQSDGKSEPRFPFLKRRGRVALIGLSTGVPTPVFVAAGRLGSPQIERLDALLAQLEREDAIRIVLIHHPPHKGGARRLRQLIDGADLRETLARRGCEAVLHGHNHRASLASVPGPDHPIPVIGAPSASARPSRTHRPGWWLIAIDEEAQARAAVSARLRLYDVVQGRFDDSEPGTDVSAHRHRHSGG
ncbi:MAG: metallophosphoesterase [Hyphomicrobiales bacterium]|nr:metallophosphoesterase [Hyphomicrobiales bacterium]MBV9430400.1 metallophosphoesterase [Hyphomicrobiales bacterium]MBV9740589.1 metallophosphoesterase [Hyphomicrobiales bacterium]